MVNEYQLHSYLLMILRVTAWLFILAATFIPLESFFFSKRKKVIQETTWGDIGFYFVSSILPQFILAVPIALSAYFLYRLVPHRIHDLVTSWPLWLRGLAAFVVADLGFYWGHRWCHEIPVLWRFHSVHHAPRHIYFLISSRAHPLDNAFVRLCGLVPIYMLGLGAPHTVQGTTIATLLMLAVTFWGFFIHANLRWRYGPLEWIFATPAFHAWHHSFSGPRDRNFASMLPCWDWIFGTAHLPRGQWPESYGIDETLPSSVSGQLLHPFFPSPASDPDQTSLKQTG